MGGSSKKQTVGYKYYLGMHMVLCHGPIDAVTRVSVDGKVAWSGSSTGGPITISATQLFGGDEREGGISGTVDIEMGLPTQGRNAYLQSKLGASIPAFRGVVGLVLRQCYLGNNPYLKRWAVRGSRIALRQNGVAQWYPEKANVGGDMNPAHLVREVLTDPDWGMGYPEADMDETSFRAAADQFHSEGMGLSLLWDKQQQLQDFLTTVLRHADGSLYVDRSSGRFMLKLARGGYTVASLPLLDEQSVDRVTDFKRATVAELTNTVTVIFWDKSTGKNNSVTVQDIALTAQQQATVGTTVQYPGFTNGNMASRAASRDLRALSTPLASATLYATRAAASLNIGDVFRFSWGEYGVSQLVMRVTNIELGELTNNLVKLTVIEDVFALGSAIYAPPPPSEWVDPIGVPLPVTQRLMTEVPYYLLARGLGDAQAQALPTTATYMMVGGVSPGGGTISAQVYVNEGPGYLQQGVMNFCPSAVLQSTIGPGVTAIDISGGQDLDLVQPNSLCLLGTGASNAREWCQVVSVTGTLLTVKRGMLDTTPAPSTAAGSRVLFIGLAEYAAELPNEYAVGEVIKAKLLTTTPKGTLALASAAEDSLTAAGRPGKPYPPGRLRLNGLKYPASISGLLTVSWSHRDRLQQTAQTLVDQDATDVGPEAGTTYTLRLYGQTGVLRKTVTGLATTSYTWATESEDSSLAGDTSLLHFNGTDGSTSIVDASGKAWSVAGTAAIRTAQSKFGGASLRLAGGSDEVVAASGYSWAWGTGDFTVECFVRPDSVASYMNILATGDYATSQFELRISDAGKLQCFISEGTNALGLLAGSTTLAAATWQHVAVTRQGGIVRMFLDGALQATSGATSISIMPTGLGRIGKRNGTTAVSFSGYIDEMRVSIGVARYTAAFTPPAAELAYVAGGLNTQVRVELESVRGGLTSQFKHDYTVARA